MNHSWCLFHIWFVAHFLTFSGLVLILAELESAKKDLAALKKQAVGLTREYKRLFEEHAKLQVGGEGREMDVNLTLEQALFTCAAGRASSPAGRFGTSWGEIYLRSGTNNEDLKGRYCLFIICVRPRMQHSDWWKMTGHFDDQTQTLRQLLTFS